MSRKFQEDHLVPELLPKLDGMVERLQAGAIVGDVGCGAANSAIAMAKAFPESLFIGYDISMHALNRARHNIDAAKIKNVRLHNPIATLAYSFSVMVCMSAGLSVPDGAGLGTLGFHEAKAREMTESAGFSRFRTVPLEGDVFNAFYEIRP